MTGSFIIKWTFEFFHICFYSYICDIEASYCLIIIISNVWLVENMNKEPRNYIDKCESTGTIPVRGMSLDQRCSAQLSSWWDFLSGINPQEIWSSRDPVISSDGVKHQGKSRPLCCYTHSADCITAVCTCELLLIYFDSTWVIDKQRERWCPYETCQALLWSVFM